MFLVETVHEVAEPKNGISKLNKIVGDHQGLLQWRKGSYRGNIKGATTANVRDKGGEWSEEKSHTKLCSDKVTEVSFDIFKKECNEWENVSKREIFK